MMNARTLVVQLTVEELDERIRSAVRAELGDRTEALMTRAQVASVLGVSVRSVTNYVRRGRLRPTPLENRIVRFRRADVDAYVEACANGTLPARGGKGRRR